MNWRGRPLTSHEVVVQSVAATTTGTGLTVHAQLDLCRGHAQQPMKPSRTGHGPVA